MSVRTLISLALTALILLNSASPAWAQRQQQDDPAARLLARMPPAARVGQLFMVTFPGTAIEEDTAIYDLIMEDRVGGVLLRPENGNIVNEGDTPIQVAELTNGLQRLAWDSIQNPLPSLSDDDSGPTNPPYLPLFIALEQEGEGIPHTAMVSGTTPLPSPMAVGATWNTSHAETMGAIMGEELSALGFNMLLGPSLDVLHTPRPDSPADLGPRSFGGDPYWVGQMSKSFIQGVHDGSDNRIAVVPRHFPGLGAADRPLSEEVSTVQKSLEQLKQIELAPFFAVANEEEPQANADGFLVSHIRYRGFQGNIYASTKPVSFDPQALQQLMALPELAPWRQGGGVTVADELGVRAVRRFYDPTEQEFNNLRIAREAFLAGNDILILSHFALDDDWESQIANMRATIAFFREKYASDPSFQARVDEAVLRILRLKLQLYGTFLLGRVQVDEGAATNRVGQSYENVAPIARDAVTLLSPPSPDLRPAPPSYEERIVIFTDDRQVSPCSGCAPVYAIPPTTIAETLVQLYGPGGTHQIHPGRVSSFTFSQLTDSLALSPVPTAEGTPTPEPSLVEATLEQADWVIFAMLDVNEDVPSSDAVRRFLADQADLLRNKHVIVFAFGAPYYLDTTEIAKLSAYFGLYSHTEPFIEAAVRALFDEFPFNGAPPVSVTGINYDMITQTQPDPSQTIEILLGDETEEGGTPPPTPQPSLGDTLELRTSVIVDRNGHRVPDRTPVEFILTYSQEGLEQTIQEFTKDGVASTEVTLDREGHLKISVRAEPLPRTVRLEMDIPEDSPATIISVTPTPSPIPSPSPSPSPAPTEEATPSPPQEQEGDGSPLPGNLGWLDLAQGIAGAVLVALVGYIGLWNRRQDLALALRSALYCTVGGLIAYIGLALEWPVLVWIRRSTGTWAAGTAALIGATIALMIVLASDMLRGRLAPAR